jgi:hypothetical protein
MKLNPGYTYSPSLYKPPVGHPRLDVYLIGKPVEGVFGTRQLRIQVLDDGEIRSLTIGHPWLADELTGTLRICPGRYRLVGWDKETHYGLCLGGELQIDSQADYTHCILQSSAPIFNLTDDSNSPGMVIASEVEALLAERQAAWTTNEIGYLKRLEQIDPLQLFIGLIVSIEAEQKLIPNAGRASAYWDEEHTLHHIIHALDQAGQWPMEPPRLEDLV